MAEILKISPRRPQPARIARAAELLRQGRVVAIPTDTFYGLAANPFDAAAVETVFAIKGRPRSAPLLLLVDSLEMAATLAASLPSLFYPLARRFWPGPLTMVVEASPRIPPVITAGTGRIGLRLPAAAIPRALIRAAGCPLTATSANRAGEKECPTAAEVENCLGRRLPLIVDGGASRAAKPSTVLSLSGLSWEVLREGAIPRDRLARFLREVLSSEPTGTKKRTQHPGLRDAGL